MQRDKDPQHLLPLTPPVFHILIALADAFRDLFDPDAAVVTISISCTRMASENYGYMAPVKAALDSSLAFLAQGCSRPLIRP